MARFWVCPADPTTGNRIVGAEERLVPGPGELIWPDAAPGVLLNTPGGNVVRQQAVADPRPRAWRWSNLAAYRPDMMRLIGRLEALVSTKRRAAGLSPWIFVRDEESHKLRQLVTATGTATGATPTTLTDTSKNWDVNALSAGYGVVEIIDGPGKGNRRSVISNTSNSLTVQGTFGTTPTNATYVVTYNDDVWVRVRVLDVVKQVRPRSGLIYESLNVSFVIDDPSWTVSDF